MKKLYNKKIVLIAPQYFGYENLIKLHLNKMGAKVYLIYENMDKISFLYKFIHSKFSSQMPIFMDHYFKKKINNIDNDIDYVLVIRGEFLTKETVQYMRWFFQRKCKFILYQWDGVENNKNAIIISSYFDKVITFDPKDAEKFGWLYQPLFYEKNLICESNKREIDLLYICSLHSKRAKVLKEIKKICKNTNLKYIAYLYEKKYIYYKRKYIDRKKEYISIDNKDVTFSSLTLLETYKLYSNSKAVIDYTHPGQKGFTMRSIECLGNKCKLITNNYEITKADFYNPNNIIVYSENELTIPIKFVNSPYENIDEKIYNKYSLDSWIISIFQ